MKHLLAGGRQLAVTRAVESLVEAKPSPDTDGFAVFDPKAPAGKAKSDAGAGSGVGAQPFKESIVFMIGGGSYLEHQSLQELAGELNKKSPAVNRSILYGATEVLSAGEFVAQLSTLAKA
mmetsp:Transcript_21793/g.70368  ORF Transcript_21793/g.70368 Transcript_21793/m.70368 type:complete len:120 (+) Transcript_21793:3-362(+)